MTKALFSRPKILKRDISRRKLREILHKFAQGIFFSASVRGETPRNLSEKLCETTRSFSVKFGAGTPRKLAEAVVKLLQRNFNEFELF